MGARALAHNSIWPSLRRWMARYQRTLLTFLTLAALAGTLQKPFNIDDPLFIWVARHIQTHPANPFSFGVNWYGTEWPMAEVTKNPPLGCYYLAAAGTVAGFSELALHGAMLLPAIAVVLGTWRLARRLCPRPFLAGVLVLFSPVFLLSSTTVMCDVLMLAFWVW